MKKALKGEVCWKVVSPVSDTPEGKTFKSGWIKLDSEGYCLLYKKGHITKRAKSSIGIFAFETRQEAEYRRSGDKVIVKALGFGKKPVPLIVGFADTILRYYKHAIRKYFDPNHNFFHGIQSPWKRTVLYEALTIIED